MKSKEPSKQPFQRSIQGYMDTYNIGLQEAIEHVKAHYEKFKVRNDALLERQIDSVNSVQVQIISHSTVLSTLILTATGVLISQNRSELSLLQKEAMMIVIAVETVSLLFGGVDYIQTAQFHKKWAKIYADIDKRVEGEVVSGDMQLLSRIGEIEAEELRRGPESTRTWLTVVMLVMNGVGLFLLPVLFFFFFF